MDVFRNRRIFADAGLFQGRGIERDLDVVQVLQIVNHVPERRVDEFDLRRLLQGLFDLLFGRAGIREPETAWLFPAMRRNSLQVSASATNGRLLDCENPST